MKPSTNFEFKQGSAQVNGLNFSWIELGSGPIALALHGFPDLPHIFRSQMQALAEAGYRVIAPDVRGYFPTAAPPNVPYCQNHFSAARRANGGA